MSPQQPADKLKDFATEHAFEEAKLAVARIYTEYLDEVTCFATHFFSTYPDCEERAENIAQEVFLKMLSRVEIAAIKNMEAWLFKATKHSCLNAIAKEKTITSEIIAAHYEMQSETDWRCINRYEWEKEELIMRKVEAELQQMDLLKRRIIYCKYYFKMTTSEIAVKLSVTPGRVRSQLQYTITKLRAKFNHHK